MGLIDRLRAELIDLIEWVDDSRHTLVWRYPRFQNEIKYGAQLIVRPGQVAVFVRQGQIADVFEPGQHKLTTKNLPVLSTLAGWIYGFESPFKAEVYFVNTRQITDLKWGTPNPVPLRDSDFGVLRVRAFGTYVLKAIDPVTLLKELVGADSHFEADEIHELLRSIINSAFADVVGKSEISLLDLAANYRDLSEQVRQAVVERVDDEYGLQIPQLWIVNISVPAEVEQALDTRSRLNVLGDMATFQAYQMGEAIPIAAANPAGGLAATGVGLGMGVAMAGPMLAGVGRAGATAGAAAPPLAAPPALWHVAENGAARGPLAIEALAEAARAGTLRRDTLVWSAGMAEWTPAGQVAQLSPLFGPPPVPPAAAPR